MNWKTLYTSKRLGAESRYETAKADLILNTYFLDYERLIFSSPFRRMQNKTQFFPVPGPIFVHNRLTQSLEVASVGRSLGKAVGVKLSQNIPKETLSFMSFIAMIYPP